MFADVCVKVCVLNGFRITTGGGVPSSCQVVQLSMCLPMQCSTLSQRFVFDHSSDSKSQKTVRVILESLDH